MTEKILILWSGGIDSTATLKLYLENTTYQIIALKIIYKSHSKDSNDRIDKERKAIKILMPHLQSIRPFEYHELLVVNPNEAYGTDVPIFGMLSIYPAYSFGCKYIVIGFVSDIRSEQLKYVIDKINVLNTFSRLFFENSKGIWKFQPKFVMSQFYYPKIRYMIELGELLPLTWFCRFPRKAKNSNGCGSCVACTHIKNVLPEMIKL